MFFYYFGIGLNLFLLVLLISKRGKSIADKILAVWLFIIGCHLALYVMDFQPVNSINIHLLGVSIPFPFMHGPLLYLYTAAITNTLPANRKVCWLHFVPAAITIIYLSPFFLMSARQKMDIFQTEGEDYKTFLHIQAIIMQLSGLVYVAWSFLLLRKHKKNIGQQFSYEERINLNWLRYLIFALLIVWAIIIFVRKDSFIFGAAVVTVVFIGFFGIKQAGIFNNITPVKLGLQDIMDFPGTDKIILQQSENPFENYIPEIKNNTHSIIEETEPGDADIKKKKYANSGLTAETLKELHNQLTQLMAEEKQYTEPELSLLSLAKRLNIHPNYLSQTINEIEGKSFYDYINTLRIEEFKRLLLMPENSKFTIMSLAADCGFNSKSSFNKNFKKVTGQSPSEYLNKRG